MGVAEDVPGVRCVDFGEEVVAITMQDERFVPRELSVEEVLWVLRHAGDGAAAQMAEMCDCPGVLVGLHEASSVGRMGEKI